MLELNAVIFDMDGLMIDTEPVGKMLVKTSHERFGYEITEDMFYHLIGTNEKTSKAYYHSVFGEDYPYQKIKDYRDQLRKEYFNSHPEMKLIIAPHVIDENHLVEIIGKLKRPSVRYTRADEKNVRKADCLIIDCFGLLSSIYRYGEIAYIGGGFGVGIHNTLEAAVYGIPVIFGPKYQKFMEAMQLIEAGGAYSIKDYNELKILLDRLLTDEAFLKKTGTNAGNYVIGNSGATEKVLHMINF